MDIISHALIGKIFCYFDKKAKGKNWLVILFSIIPDFALIPFYIILGKENQRFLWIAQNQDWIGSSITHPILTNIYNITHSIFFALLIILPVVLIFKMPKSAFFAYLSHIIIDIFTHTGEWTIKIFYPLNFNLDGFSDAWQWPFYLMIVSWIILLSIIFLLNKKNARTVNKN
jgi:membrane-bound metal-dependent hydrolase YbcI (DUF457 family)